MGAALGTRAPGPGASAARAGEGGSASGGTCGANLERTLPIGASDRCARLTLVTLCMAERSNLSKGVGVRVVRQIAQMAESVVAWCNARTAEMRLAAEHARKMLPEEVVRR